MMGSLVAHLIDWLIYWKDTNKFKIKLFYRSFYYYIEEWSVDKDEDVELSEAVAPFHIFN